MYGRLGKCVASQTRPSGALIPGIGLITISVAAVMMGLFIPPEEWCGHGVVALRRRGSADAGCRSAFLSSLEGAGTGNAPGFS
jgi:hypothetical protein